ncbi:hypothetical protein [Azospirillum sp.]|uniref:hypothetical protein n=1 Tax=Azospirillum sp. TaxID=34012 RepID=UPI002D251605|nr:hypothetical protein [Azospirillum sp.]HYD66586.1 hypothetical protein [Azospirillum sp.]
MRAEKVHVSVRSDSAAGRLRPDADDRTDLSKLLAWKEAGMPDDAIDYSDAPKTTRADWQDAESVQVVFKRK